MLDLIMTAEAITVYTHAVATVLLVLGYIELSDRRDAAVRAD